MGCGESKHDVASGNVVKSSSRRSGSKKGGYDNLPSEKPAVGDSSTGSAVQDKINEKAAGIIAAKEESVKVEEKFEEVKEEKKEDDKSVPSVKENNNEKVKVAEEKKEDDKLKAEAGVSEKETTIAKIITEGVSDKSEYNTPVAKTETPKLKDVVVQEAQKEEGGELKEEIPVKAETVPAVLAEGGKASTMLAEEANASTVIAEEAKVLPAAVEQEKPSTVIAEEAKVLPVAVEAEKPSTVIVEEAKVLPEEASTTVTEEAKVSTEKPLTATSAVEEKVSPVSATPAPAPVTAAKEETAAETAVVDSKTN